MATAMVIVVCVARVSFFLAQVPNHRQTHPRSPHPRVTTCAQHDAGVKVVVRVGLHSVNAANSECIECRCYNQVQAAGRHLTTRRLRTHPVALYLGWLLSESIRKS